MNTLFALWASLVGSVAAMLGVFAALPAQTARPPSESGALLQVFIAMGVLQTILGFVVPHVLARLTLKGRVHSTGQPTLSDSQLAQAALTPLIVRLALFESVVILGALGGMLTGNQLLTAGLGGTGLLLMLASFPSRALQRKLLGLRENQESLSRRLSK